MSPTLAFEIDDFEDDELDENDLYEPEDLEIELPDIDEDEIYCPECGEIIEDGLQCDFCGYVLGLITEKESEDYDGKKWE